MIQFLSVLNYGYLWLKELRGIFMKKNFFSSSAFILLTIIIACQTPAPRLSKSQFIREQDKAPAGKIYNEKGLIVNVPAPNQYTDSEPGETSVSERAYIIAPPFIPHSIRSFSITRENNDCMNCHLEGMEVSEGHSATRIPESHFLNSYKNQKTVEHVTGTRYYCIQCHVPQTDSVPPVGMLK